MTTSIRSDAMSRSQSQQCQRRCPSTFLEKSSNRTSSTTLSSDESCAGHVVEYSDLAIHSPTRGPKVQRNLEAHSNAQWRHMSSRYFGISLNIHRGARHDVKPSRHADEVHAKELK